MKKWHAVGLFLGVLALFLTQTGLAATVEGHVFKEGQTDHSGIRVSLDPMPTTPAIGVTGLVLLFLGLSGFLFWKRVPGMVIPVVMCLVTGFSCITYATMRMSTMTNILGEYDFSDVDPGDYYLDASAPGFYPEHIASFSVMDGMNTAPDITLVPMETPTPAPTDTPSPACDAGSLVSVDHIVGSMRCVPSGHFTQGSPPEEFCRNDGESQFTHRIARNLAVMETEVTRRMWADLQAVQPDLPVDPSDIVNSPGSDHPVQMVTWFEAVLFANLLSQQNGYARCYFTDSGFTTPVDATNYTAGPFYCHFNANGYRLASEGEWEYFCRAGTDGTFSCDEPNFNPEICGECPAGLLTTLDQYCVYCANHPGTLAEVGTKLANPWGLKDVHGNVSEWCWDWRGDYPEGTVVNYEGPVVGSSRIARGGAMSGPASLCRCASRFYASAPENRYYTRGFRIVRLAE